MQPPVPDAQLAPIRAYLQQAFPGWELAEQWDGDLEAHTFRLTRHHEPVHLLKVSRPFLEDNQPTEIAAIVAQLNVAHALQATPQHRILLASHGLQLLPPPAA